MVAKMVVTVVDNDREGDPPPKVTEVIINPTTKFSYGLGQFCVITSNSIGASQKCHAADVRDSLSITAVESFQE